MQVPVVQWIEQVPPKNQIQVRFLVGTPKHYHGASGDSSKLSAHRKKTTFRGGFFTPLPHEKHQLNQKLIENHGFSIQK